MFNSKVPSSSTAEGGGEPSLVPDLNETLVEDEAEERAVAFAIGEEDNANFKKRKAEATNPIGQAEADHAKKHCKEAEAETFQKMMESLKEMHAKFNGDLITLVNKFGDLITVVNKFAKQPPVAFINRPDAALDFKPISSTAEAGVKPFLVPDLNEAFVEDEAIGEEEKANSKKKVGATSEEDMMRTFSGNPLN